ncbi:hypothetical protein EDB84DRAFT_1070074 [Lactarius hengduanensis]|nr:hypothetical protein EDB84DRAFT_1070074 [Lactarius hengduanensis]
MLKTRRRVGSNASLNLASKKAFQCLAFPSRLLPPSLLLVVASCPKCSGSPLQLKHIHTPTPALRGATLSTLFSPPSRSATTKDGRRDPDAVFGALASTYGWGVHIPTLPSEPAATGKTPATKPATAQKEVAAPAPSTSHQPLPRQLTQAQREQAIVDLSSRYGYASPLAGGRWKM